MSCGAGCRYGLDPALLWLWRRLAVAAPIRPLAWEPSYAAEAAQKNGKKDKKKKKRKKSALPLFSSRSFIESGLTVISLIHLSFLYVVLENVLI